MRRGGLVLLIAVAIFASYAERAFAWPDWAERWLFNPAERTRQGDEAMRRGELEEAVGAFDSALRLAPEDPGAQYNAGTVHLAAERPDAAALLEKAVEGAAGDPQLAARAAYNLGNAQLANQQLPAAIDAYKNALRVDPGFADAKFNLELALRQLEEQQNQQNQDQQNQDQQNQDQQDQQQQQDQQEQDQQEEQEQDQKQNQQNEEQQEQQQQDQQQQDQQQQEQQQQEQQQQEQQQQQQQEQQQQQQGEQEQQQRLPQFEDLPDMTAEEAAAILEAVENMEREQRRQEALEAMKQNAGGKKDW